MDSTTIKLVCEQCQRGEFQNALRTLKKYKFLPTKHAIKVIINCCSICASNIDHVESIEAVGLHELLKLITPFIKAPNEAELLSYIQTMYHILKMYIRKEICSILRDMEEILFPKFLPFVLPKKVGETYHHTAIILYNFIIKYASVSDQIPEKVWIKLSLMVSRMCSYPGPLNPMNFSYNCLLTIKKLNISNDLLGEYCLEVFRMMGKGTLVQSDDCFVSVLKITVIILNRYLQNNEFVNYDNFLMKMYNSTEVFKQKEYVYLGCILRFPLLLLSPDNNLTKVDVLRCRESLLMLHGIWNNSNVFQQIGNNVHSILHWVMEHYKRENCDQIVVDFNVDVCGFLYDLARLESQSDASCSCKCNTTKSIYRSFVYGNIITSWISISISCNKNISVSSHKQITALLAKFFHYIVQLKREKCEKWKEAWDGIGLATYNIGVNLYRQNDYAALEYFYLIVNNYLLLGGKSGTFKLKLSMLASSFTAIINLNSTDYRRVMAFSALAILLCPNQRDSFIQHWNWTKHSRGEKDIEKTTLVAAFATFKAELACVVQSDSLLNSNDQIDLLVYELESYKKKWKSKVPMWAAFEELCATADLDTKVKIAVGIFGHDEIPVHENVRKIIQDIFQQYRKAKQGVDDLQSKTFLAILNFLNYKYLVKDIIMKNAKEMERKMVVLSSKRESRDAATRELIEQCDIVASYENLWLDNYVENMKFLDTALGLLSTVVAETTDNFVGVKLRDIYKILIKISLEYKLHMHSVRYLQALQLALKIAQKLDSAKDIVETVALIIEKSDIKKTYVKYLTLLADQQLDNLDLTEVEDLKTMLKYLINKSRLYLYSDCKESLRLFNIANDMFCRYENKENLNSVKSQFLLLHYKLLMLPCEWNVADHKNNDAFVQMSIANEIIYNEYNANKLNNVYGICLLLDAIEELVSFYFWLRCPREVRCHCKDTIILAQNLVLPLRSATFLKYLAHADLRHNNFDECQVKLNGMADILCLTQHHLPLKDTISNVMELENAVDDLTNDFRDLAMSLPPVYEKQSSLSSPKFLIAPYKLPSFLNHDETCECFFCICIEYRELVLEKNKLDALINNKQDNRIVANDFYEGALKVYQVYCDKYENYLNTNANFISYDLIPDYKEDFVMVYTSLLFEYSYFLRRSGDKSRALAINLQALHLLVPKKVQHNYLYNELLVQRLGYLTESLVAEENKVESKIDTLDVYDTKAEKSPTTPVTKKNKVVFTMSCSPNLSPPKRMVKKCLTTFKLSPVEDGESEKKTKNSPGTYKQPETPIAKSKIANKKKESAGASKIHVYTGATKKTYKPKKANESVKAEALVVSTGSSTLRIESGLKTRTKLLTEKLKQSSTTVNTRDNDKIIVADKVQNKAHLKSKNLLNAIVNSDTEEVKNGTVRRSQRHQQ